MCERERKRDTIAAFQATGERRQTERVCERVAISVGFVLFTSSLVWIERSYDPIKITECVYVSRCFGERLSVCVCKCLLMYAYLCVSKGMVRFVKKSLVHSSTLSCRLLI